MFEDKKDPAVKEKSQDKSSCDSQRPQSCDKEDKDAKKAGTQPDAKKNPAQQNTGHKHGGSCSH